MAEMETVDAGGLQVRVRQDGPKDAPAVLLLHSLGTNLHVWDPVVSALAAAFRVIRPDMRGHGGTALTNGPYSIAQLGADVLAVMDALGVRMADVVGLSIGGLIAQDVARQAPGRVRSLILMDTALAIPPASLWHERAATVRRKGMAAIADAVLMRWVTPEAPPHAAAPLRAMLLATAPEGYAGAAEAIAAADQTASTRALGIRTLVLVGDADQATPLASAEAIRDAIAGAKLEVIAGASHIPTAEQPAAVAGAMLRFLLPDAYAAGLRVRRRYARGRPCRPRHRQRHRLRPRIPKLDHQLGLGRRLDSSAFRRPHPLHHHPGDPGRLGSRGGVQTAHPRHPQHRRHRPGHQRDADARGRLCRGAGGQQRGPHRQADLCRDGRLRWR